MQYHGTCKVYITSMHIIIASVIQLKCNNNYYYFYYKNTESYNCYYN